MSSYLLSLAIWVPIIGAIPVLALGSERRNAVRWLSLAVAVAGFLVTLPLYAGFDRAYVGMQFVELAPWIPRFNVQYFLGVDGISVLFILLNAFITIMVVIAGWEVIESKVAQYMAAFLVMSGLMNGIFAALDAVLFYVFFEASLIPMYIIIGVWGGPNRVYAAFKFFLYTLLGSLLMLVALVYLFLQSGGSFNLLEWHQLRLELTPQILLFVAFRLAFARRIVVFRLFRRHGRLTGSGLENLHWIAVEGRVGEQLGGLLEVHDGEPELAVVLVDAGAAADDRARRRSPEPCTSSRCAGCPSGDFALILKDIECCVSSSTTCVPRLR